MDIKLIFKSFIVGIGKIIPGVSGSMLAMTLGIYEDIINAVTCFWSKPKDHFKLLFNFVIGLFIAIIFFSRVVSYFLNNYYEVTMYLFVGLILGTLIPFSKKLKISCKNVFIFMIFFIILVLISFNYNTQTFIFNKTTFDYLYISFLGMIDAFTSIIPGISGTAIFMLLGSYEFVLSILGNPFQITFIIYGIGLVTGLVIICYIMRYLLSKWKNETYSMIFVFMVGSILILMMDLIHCINILYLIVGGIGVVLGIIFEK